ncbi:MAG: pitrilysin family protein [bacterium]
MNNFRITTLPNGIRIVSELLPYVKSFSLGVWFKVGSRDETPTNNGICHFIEHMVFKGTKKRNAKRIADEIESLGGYLNAFTSKESTCFYGRGLSLHLEKTFEVLADMVQNSVFDPKEIKKEASVIIEELYDIEDSPEELIFDKFESNIYAGNHLALPIIGTEENIKNFRRDDLFRFIDEHYKFNNMYIIASGAVDHDKLVEYTYKYFIKDLGKQNLKRKPVRLKNTGDLHVPKDIQQVHVILGRTTYGYNNSERIKVSLLSHILGEGSSSRLFQKVREKNGITYQINSFLNSFHDISTFGVYFSTNEKTVNKALDLTYKELDSLRSKKVSDKELKKAKEYLKGQIIMSLESTSNRMLRIAHSIIHHNRIKEVEETIVEIDSVFGNDILKIAEEILVDDAFSRVIISTKDSSNRVAA